jgi:hypothetical protein
MGRKKLEKPSAETLNYTLSRMLVPANILENFDIFGAEEFKERWVIELREKEGLIPVQLQGIDNVVFDGYCNPIETLSHSFVCKPIYMKLYRRRYKRSGSDEHFSNVYDFTLKGVKMVPELGFFLKDEG